MALLIWLGISFSSSAEPAIVFASQVDVHAKSELHLADLANISGFGDSKVEEALREIPLGDAPRSGEMRKFTDVGLAQLLRAHLSNLSGPQNIRLVIPQLVMVRGSSEFPSNMVQIELKDRLQELCSPCQIEFTQWNTPNIQTKSPIRSWRLGARAELPKGNFSIPIELTYESGGRESLWLTGNLAVKKTIAVAKNSKLTGEVIQAADLSEELRDITFLSQQPASRLDAEGSITLQALTAGDVIRKASLRRQPGTTYGETVKVISNSERWQIAIEGISQKSAQIGETVSVKIPRTQKVLTGKLISRGVVEVQ